MTAPLKSCYLFGGERPWTEADWTSSDDRVRGGKSHSYIACAKESAEFYGNLDIKTLGGAGFASQRTTGDDRVWNLEEYDGVVLDIAAADNKRYTFILKDGLLPQNPENGREQATISYEYDFYASDAMVSASGDIHLFIPWKSLKATYRGREKEDAPAIDLKRLKRISIMNRSFFGDQEGGFTLTLKSIRATSLLSDHDDEGWDRLSLDKEPRLKPVSRGQRLQTWLFSCFRSKS